MRLTSLILSDRLVGQETIGTPHKFMDIPRQDQAQRSRRILKKPFDVKTFFLCSTKGVAIHLVS